MALPKVNNLDKESSLLYELMKENIKNTVEDSKRTITDTVEFSISTIKDTLIGNIPGIRIIKGFYDTQKNIIQNIRDRRLDSVSNFEDIKEDLEVEKTVSLNDEIMSIFHLMLERMTSLDQNFFDFLMRNEKDELFKQEKENERIFRQEQLINAIEDLNNAQEQRFNKSQNEVSIFGDDEVSKNGLLSSFLGSFGGVTAAGLIKPIAIGLTGALAGLVSGFVSDIFVQIRGIFKYVTSTQMFKSLLNLKPVEFVISNLQKFLTTVKGVFSSLNSIISPALNFIGKIFKPLVEFGSTILKTLNSSMLFKLTSVLGKLASRIFFPVTIVLGIYETITGAIDSFKTGGVVGAITGGLQSLYDFLIGDILNIVNSFGGKLVSWFSSLFSFELPEDFKLSDIVYNGIEKIINWFEQLFDFKLPSSNDIKKSLNNYIPEFVGFKFDVKEESKPTKYEDIRTNTEDFTNLGNTTKFTNTEDFTNLGNTTKFTNTEDFTNLGNTTKFTNTEDFTNLGNTTKKYEGGDVDTISSGKNDVGGQSYGAFQIATNVGTMKSFMNSPEFEPFRNDFEGLTPGTESFNIKYRQILEKDSELMNKSQKDFLIRTHYKPLRDYANKKGINTNNPAIQEALFSMSLQHSPTGWKTIINNIDTSKITNNKELVEQLYNERSRYVSNLAIPNKPAILNRYRNESSDIISQLDNGIKTNTNAIQKNQNMSRNLENGIIERENLATSTNSNISGSGNIVNVNRNVNNNSTTISKPTTRNQDNTFSRLQEKEMGLLF